ncbi:MAG: hypothetical protein QM774_09700 [Gordonia sp. (in: high G+C Gram-positive bacteria)]|uniref:hypothetical protein n=1 Tax=Gordonia sp. (in: high G+C Gram-positive bacteria) TaxID=84139 RepID=UPI0039E5EB21
MAAAVAAGAAGAVLAGTLSAPPANAEVSIPFMEHCAPGGYEHDKLDVGLADVEATADCRDAQKSVIATAGDAVLNLFGVNLPVGLATMNTAFATPGIGFPSGLDPFIDGTATIKGTGYNTALVVLGGDASAKSDYFMAGAIAVASTGGVAKADSLFGGSIATAVNNPIFGNKKNQATAKALPMGLAISNSMSVLHPYSTSSTALMGISSASASVDESVNAVCTAVYGEASVKDGDAKNVKSCTSVLFIFQQSQQGSDPVIYAIKNPLDVGLVSPYGDNIADLLSQLGDLLGGDVLPTQVIDLLAGKFVPEFKSDIVRISFENGTPKIGTDIPEWLGGLFGSTNSSGSNSLFGGSGILSDLSGGVDDLTGGLTSGLGGLLNGTPTSATTTLARSAEPTSQVLDTPVALKPTVVPDQKSEGLPQIEVKQGGSSGTSGPPASDTLTSENPIAPTGTDSGGSTGGGTETLPTTAATGGGDVAGAGAGADDTAGQASAGSAAAQPDLTSAGVGSSAAE